MSTASIKNKLAAENVRLAVMGVFAIGFLGLSLPVLFEPMTFWTGIVLGDYLYPMHELHHFVLGGVLGVLVLGVLVQAVGPKQRIGALHTSIVIWSSITVVSAVIGEFSPMNLVLLALLVGMAVAHPAGRAQIPSLETLDRRMFAFATVTAAGGIAFAAMELSAHLTATDAHVAFGHYQFMAVTGLSVAALALYGSFRGNNWRFPAYAAAGLMLVFGLASVVYPGAEQGSSFGVLGGLVVALWAILFVAVAERGDTITSIFD